MKKIFSVNTAMLYIIVLVSIICSCKKKDDGLLPTVTTTLPSAVTDTTAVLGGSISNHGSSPITAKGVCYAIIQNPVISSGNAGSSGNNDTFAISVTGLAHSNTYYVRAYATNSSGTAYGNQYSFTTSFSVGQTYGGGTVFFVDSTGQHGLITSPDLGPTSWSNGSYIVTGGISQSNGKANTEAIISAQGTGNYAASICSQYNGGGFSDWYLPSINEMNYLNTQLLQNNYWSSTEYNDTAAYELSSYVQIDEPSSKANSYYIRAIRTF